MSQNGTISNAGNPAVETSATEVGALEAELATIGNEIASTQNRLSSLGKHKAEVEFKVANLKAKHAAMITQNTRLTTNTLNKALSDDDVKLRALQSQIANIQVSREVKLQELGAINTLGHNADNSLAAGAKQNASVDVARYDLVVPDVSTGQSHDPLAQTPSKGRLGGHFDKRQHEHFAVGIDAIGDHITGSPYVHKEDYLVTGPRPTSSNVSAKFGEWHSPTFSGTRVAQPPGGYSNMQSIFG